MENLPPRIPWKGFPTEVLFFWGPGFVAVWPQEEVRGGDPQGTYPLPHPTLLGGLQVLGDSGERDSWGNGIQPLSPQVYFFEFLSLPPHEWIPDGIHLEGVFGVGGF